MDSSTYLAKDGQAGGNGNSGTNGATILQWMIDQIGSSGGRICLRGTWALATTTVTIANHGVALIGEAEDLAGSAGTILTYSGTGVALHVFSASIRLQRVRIESLTIAAIGAAITSASAIGLRGMTVEAFTIHRVTVRDFEEGIGIAIDTDTGVARYTAQVVIFDSFIVSAKTGIFQTGDTATSGTNTVQIMNTVLIGKAGPTAGSKGISADGFTNGGLILGGDIETYETAFEIAGDEFALYKTRTEDISTTHVSILAGASNTLISHHLFTGGGTKVSNSGTNTIYGGNGFEQTGSSTIAASTSVTVTHTLYSTPTAVTITSRATGFGTAFVGQRTATVFSINVTVSGTFTFDWTAYYWP